MPLPALPDAEHASGERGSVDAAVSGTVQGRTLSGRFRLRLSGHDLAIAPSGGTESMLLPLGRVSGAVPAAGGGGFVLHLDSGERLEVSGGSGVGELYSDLEDAACPVGEVMRSSRVAGSTRAAPGEEHDRFFAPFLEARLRLQSVPDVRQRLEAVSASELRAGVLHALESFARDRFASEPADRRALSAELEEYAQPLLDALDDVDAAALKAREALPEHAWTAWRAWRDSLAKAFTMAERAWLRTMPVLAEFSRPKLDTRKTAARRRFRR